MVCKGPRLPCRCADPFPQQRQQALEEPDLNKNPFPARLPPSPPPSLPCAGRWLRARAAGSSSSELPRRPAPAPSAGCAGIFSAWSLPTWVGGSRGASSCPDGAVLREPWLARKGGCTLCSRGSPSPAGSNAWRSAAGAGAAPLPASPAAGAGGAWSPGAGTKGLAKDVAAAGVAKGVKAASPASPARGEGSGAKGVGAVLKGDR